MSGQNNQNKTSKKQILSFLINCRHCLQNILGHFYKWRGTYSFLSGITLTIIFTLAFVWYGLFAYPLPWKITDPSDPRFNPNNFKFEDYGSSIGNVLTCMFPIGTDKDIVDNVLVKSGRAEITKYESKNSEFFHPNEYLYTHSSLRQRYLNFLHSLSPLETRFSIVYDSNNKIKSAPYGEWKCNEVKNNGQ